MEFKFLYYFIIRAHRSAPVLRLMLAPCVLSRPGVFMGSNIFCIFFFHVMSSRPRIYSFFGLIHVISSSCHSVSTLHTHLDLPPRFALGVPSWAVSRGVKFITTHTAAATCWHPMRAGSSPVGALASPPESPVFTSPKVSFFHSPFWRRQGAVLSIPLQRPVSGNSKVSRQEIVLSCAVQIVTQRHVA